MNTGGGPALVPGGSSLNMELWINDYDNEWGSGGDGTGGSRRMVAGTKGAR